MFKKVHLRLAMLFTIVSTFILTIMSVFYLYFNYQSLHKNALLSFQSDINTFMMSFEKNTSISYDWLLNMQNNYDYSFYIYDNGVPFRFTQDTKTNGQKLFIDNLRDYYHGNFNSIEDSYTSMHQEFSYSSDGQKYYVSVITISGITGYSEVYVVHSLSSIETQLNQLYLRFTVIILLSGSVLFGFSWFYTKHLLKPINESQIRQAQFIAAASHEIRNPVNTILSALSAMDKGNDKQRQEFTAIAKKEGRRLTLLTDDLLMLARSDNHSFSTQFGKAELDTIVLDCYEAFAAPAREKNIRLSVELPEGAVIASNIDSERIKQVIAILLDNAISYTPDSGTVILRCSETSKAYLIEVIDNGIGIDDSHKNNIFQRFYRADDSRESKEHFGLGLSIANEIINLHHGSITVKDTDEGGATFIVSIPK